MHESDTNSGSNTNEGKQKNSKVYLSSKIEQRNNWMLDHVNSRKEITSGNPPLNHSIKAFINGLFNVLGLEYRRIEDCLFYVFNGS